MIILIPKRNWKPFLEDFGVRRAAWPARIEVEGHSNAPAYGDEETKLNSITACDRNRGFVIDVSLASSSDAAVHHSIENPVRIVYTVSHGKAGGVIEIQDFGGSKTRIYVDEPSMRFLEAGEERRPEAALTVV